MLNVSTVGAALATILSTQITGSLITSPANGATQSVQNSTSNVLVTATDTARTAFTTAQISIEPADSSNTPGVVEKIDPAGVMLGLVAVGSVAVGVALSARNANNPFKFSSTPYRSNSKLNSHSQDDTIRIEQASRGLQKKLLRLLHDDRDTALRLLSQIKIKNPNKSINWCAEKVIYDLERDRGGY